MLNLTIELFIIMRWAYNTDLQRLLFGSDHRITWIFNVCCLVRTIELQVRWNIDLMYYPHSIVYYQSYHKGVLQRLLAAINMSSGQCQTLHVKLDPTSNQQDCLGLGMTTLHILACSSVHDLELYRVIVEKYPANLITNDRWGALPLLYAFWGAAPVRSLSSYLRLENQSPYPGGYEFDWTISLWKHWESTLCESIALYWSANQLGVFTKQICNAFGFLLQWNARENEISA